jgi:hypothetical protein
VCRRAQGPRILILDCCFSGRATALHMGGGPTGALIGQIDIEDIYILTA